MPHFKSTSLTIPALPFCSSHYEHEIHILAHFTSCAFKNSSLLHARYILQKFSPKDFFLTIKKDKSHQYLVKCDKYSKIAPIEIAKNTLLLLANKQQNLLSHNLNPKNISPRFKLPFIKNIQDFLDFSALLKNLPLKQPKIWLEIGFGSGRHLLHNAKTNPEILHIGLEIHHPSLEQVARQIGLCNLKNILILSYDARIFLELLPTNALDRIFVHFPVPWEKKPHRRIFTPSFLKHAHRVLKDNSTLELRTDSQEYFKDSVVLAEDSKLFTLQKFKNKPADIISKYEARWIREQKDIYDLNLTANAIPKKERIVYDFSFPKGDLLKHLPTVDLSNFSPYKIRKRDYFLNLEDLFFESTSTNTSTPPKKILKISFGDFNYPESRYIILGEKIEYFREEPLPTWANYQSHKTLCQLLFKER